MKYCSVHGARHCIICNFRTTFTIWLTIITQPSDVHSSLLSISYTFLLHADTAPECCNDVSCLIAEVTALNKGIEVARYDKCKKLYHIWHKQGFSHGHIMHSSQEYSQPGTWATSYQLAHKYSHSTPPNTTLMCFYGISLWLKMHTPKD